MYNIVFSSQHATHLEALLRENQNLSTSDIHDSGVRTLCISELKKLNLEKVLMECHYAFPISFPSLLHFRLSEHTSYHYRTV